MGFNAGFKGLINSTINLRGKVLRICLAEGPNKLDDYYVQ